MTRLLRLSLSVILFTSFILGPAGALAAQRGSVEGTVADPAGSRVAEARVALRDRTGAPIYQARTDAEGRFTLANVRDGDYTLTVEAPGLSQAERPAVEVRDGRAAPVSVTLAVAAIADRMVVTATRTETPIDELGGAVTVIAAEDLARAGQSLVSEPLRLVPGLIVAQTGGRGGITSVFTRGGESDYNKVLIDGVPVNFAGGLYDFAGLTPENLERVEVARGPRSALFGSDAMTGVIHLVTRRGTTRTPEVELTGEGGSFGYNRETARLSGLAGWFDYSTSFGFQRTGGRFENSDFINRSASANLGFRLAGDAELRVTSRWNNNTLGVPGPTAVQFADPDQRQKRRDLALAAAFDHRATARWRQTARYIYSESDTYSFDRAGQVLTPPGVFGFDSPFNFRDHQKRAGLHYQSTIAVSAGHLLTAGVDYEHESAVFTDDFSRVSPDRDNLGFYVQDQMAWRDRLFVTAGVRLERNTGDVPADLRAALAAVGSVVPTGDVGFGFSANPKVAATYVARRAGAAAPLGATRLRAGFGTGIKEPSLTEAFSPSPFFLGNPSLAPERARGFDLGLAQEFLGRRASLEVTYFDNRFRDMIAFVFDPATFGQVRLPDGRLTNFVNLERATARGVEVIGAARPLLRWRLAASYTFLRSRVERDGKAVNSEVGLPLLRRPRHSGTMEVGWVGDRFDATLEGSLVGGRRDLDPLSGARFGPAGRPIFNDGYAKLNAGGSYRFSQTVTAFARVENLLNQDYEEVLGFPAYRLNFSAGLRVRLGGGR